ncbi:SPRY domain-containing protein 3-like protein [Lates japonicus]|uniref:SPRY domain-containing protein 3-like protein n=1 Tax=Lates japonicus TaxID=270547 RepID=A0AAD3RCT6_LATJO|nr:SPRY domain-containing protein 3-like protein [Lates japonicus]
MDDINLHYRFLNWRRRIREIREVRAVRYRERLKRMLRDGDILRYHGNSDEVGCFVAARPLSRRNRYFEDYPKNRHPGWSRGSIAYHADDGKLFQGSGVGDAFGPRCFEGDIMGCGIMFPRDFNPDGGDDVDDWDLDVFPKPSEVQNDLYANNEDEEEDGGEDLEGRKVMVFFTRNGKVVGRREVALPVGGFFPTIGMMSTGEKVRVDLHPLSG